MKILAYVVVGLVALLAIVIGAGFAAVNLLDWKPYIAEAASEAMGRELRIDGDVEVGLSLGLQLDFAAERVRLANVEGAAPADMLTLGAITGRIQLWPYFTSRAVVIDSLVAREPVVNLAVDAAGRPNWTFADKVEAAAPREGADDAEPPFSGLRISELSVVDGGFSFSDAVSGQSVNASEIKLEFTLSDLDRPLVANGGMVLNKEPVALKVEIDTPNGLLRGPEAKTVVALTTKHAEISYRGRVIRQPVDGLDGVFDADIPSVGKLAAWLDRPLAKGQPDPGPLKVRAEFASEGAKVTLKEATVQGQALKARAAGSYDGSGNVSKVTLKIDSEVLDIDRYLPPAKPKTAQPAKERQPTGNPLAQLSDESIDLSALRRTEADIKVAIAGVRAMGFELGKVDFSARAQDGVLTADLARLALYGGAVSGQLTLDAKADALGLSADLMIDKVRVDQLAKAATGEAKVAGIASGRLQATSRGKSQRALAKNVQGNVDFSLGDVKGGPVAAITGVNLKLDLPSLDKQPTLRGDVVYNNEKVEFGAAIDPLQKVLEADSFKAEIKLSSKPLALTYSGAVQHRPVPGLDGRFDLEVPSVAALAAWLDQPLAKGQPDPGPLKVQAVFASEGAKVTLKEATVQGQALKARAAGSYDGSGDIGKVVLSVDSEALDIDRYLPPRKPKTAQPAGERQPTGNPLAQLSDESIDLSALRRTEADIKVAIAGVRAMGFELGKVDFSARAKDGVLTADLARLALYGGAVSGRLTLDAKAEALGLSTDLTVDKVRVDRLAKAATGEAGIAAIASGRLQATSRGKSQRDLARNVQGNADFSLGEVKGAPVAGLTGVNLKLDLSGLEKRSSLRGDVVYNNEKVEFSATVDPLQTVLEADRFKAEFKLSAKPLALAYAGAVQHRPVPGLDGRFDLEVPSVAVLAAWLGQPLGKDQPDPGPLKVTAELASEGDKFIVKQATISGKAIDARASGSFRAEQPVPRFEAKIEVQQANLNAYLPPEAAKPAASPAAPPAASEWSREPYDFSSLKAANGKAEVNLAKVAYRNLNITRGRITAALEGGTLQSNVESLELAGGTVGATARIDASADAAKVSYRASVKGVQARPLLTAFAGTDRLSGTATLEAEGTSQGRSQWDLVNALQGKGNFTFLDGAIHGVNLAAMLRQARTLGMSQQAGEEQKTDFAELSGSYVITNGIVDNRDFKMLAPLLRLAGAGKVPLPPQTLDYTVEAKLVGTLQGQGGKDALSGLPIPVHITGSWQQPQYRVNWDAVVKSIAADPSRLTNMPKSLSDRAKDLGIQLPGAELLKQLPGAGTTQEKSGDTGSGGAPPPNPLDALKGLLKK